MRERDARRRDDLKLKLAYAAMGTKVGGFMIAAGLRPGVTVRTGSKTDAKRDAR
jgi:hypothetical protein